MYIAQQCCDHMLFPHKAVRLTAHDRACAVPSVAVASALSSSCEGIGLHLHTCPTQYSRPRMTAEVPAPRACNP